MKTKTTVSLLFIFIVLNISAQPQKGSWEIGGSGYWTKIYNNKELNNKITEINAEVAYFPYKFLSVGGILTYQKDKDYMQAFDPVYHNFFIAPTLDAYILNRKMYGISIKGALNFAVISDLSPGDKAVPSFMFGPKASWNITPNLSTYLWIAYRKLDEFDNTNGFRAIVPSKNFDIRWAFSYYLHRREKVKSEL
jgi:hypothetical protein